MSVQWPLEAALAARLTGDAPYVAAVTGGTHAGKSPQGATMPRVVVGERTETDDSGHDWEGAETTVTFHIYATTSKTVLTIYGHLRRLLHRVPLTIGGHAYQMGTLELVTTMVDDDGTAMHGVVRFRIRTEEE